ncbi:MAG: hypothetical protein LBG62_05900 [Candidatus Methanoplasma sp.]|jgi:hypothetical protein|nr:hypothetical protein [Candidatus Methanoplasma sp.]
MSNYTAIFTDVPLEALRLERLSDCETIEFAWKSGRNLVCKGFWEDNRSAVQRICPGMSLYISRNHLNTDMVDLAREYLDHGEKIAIVMLQDYDCPPKEEMPAWVIDLKDTPYGTMPPLRGKRLRPNVFNVYEFVKGKRDGRRDDMFEFTAIFTEIPLGALGLKCLRDPGDGSDDRWITGSTEIEKRFDFGDADAVRGIYPGLSMCFSRSPLNADMVDLAREYLDNGLQIVFVALRTYCYPRHRDLKKRVADITGVAPGTMPGIGGRALAPRTLEAYRFVKPRPAKRPAGVDWEMPPEFHGKNPGNQFTAVFTDLPLCALEMKCLKEHKRGDSWTVGETIVSEGIWGDHRDAVRRMYPDMSLYCSPGPITPGLIDLAEEYLDHGRQIVFVTLRRFECPPREDMDAWRVFADMVYAGTAKANWSDDVSLTEPFVRYRYAKTKYQERIEPPDEEAPHEQA